jgi:SAM-dependent methyltransferase
LKISNSPSPAGDTAKYERPCPVCGAGAGLRLGRLKFAAFDDSPLNGAFDLAACPGCGLVFYDAALDPEAVANYYRVGRRYITAAGAGVGGDDPADLKHQAEIANFLSAGIPPEYPVFDVGCGRGGLLKALRRAGFRNLRGVDLSPEMTADIEKRLGIPAAPAPADRLPFPDTAPGLLIYSHVLEHAAEPGAPLREAARRLAPGGRVFIEVPDASAYPLDIPYQEFYLEHLNHFDAASLSRLLAETGFQALEMDSAVFALPAGRRLPVLRALAGRAGDNEEASVPKPGGGSSAAEHIPRYLAWSAGHPALGGLAKLAYSGRPLWVWGLSQLTMLLLGGPALARAEIAGLIDRDPSKIGRLLGGRSVAGPEVLAGRPSNEALLLAAWGREASMRSALAGLGFPGPVFSISELTTN